MNFVTKALAARNGPHPTYHFLPNLATRPFPDGPLDLGTVVEDLQEFYAINQGNSRVAIPDGQRYIDVKGNVMASAKSSFSGMSRLHATAFHGSIGGDVSLRAQRIDEDVYTIARLETAYFYPSRSYIKQCLRLVEVKDYLDMADYKEPVYLVTGLKIARGATVSTKHGREFTSTARAHAQVPAGLADARVGAQAGVSVVSQVMSSFSTPTDFVVGVRVLKLYYKRGFFGGQPSLVTKREVKNAVLTDHELVPEEEDDEAFTVADLDGSDVDGFVPMHHPWAEDETWLVPRDLAE
ncbi:hypothetical protein F5144DRAFT_179154 [Chaetomium tenue]|uniref:Uncharacterized protein n=1 Tax=Chaetomium tenue TaxID=1854479 RepID=A0ACB7PEL6_9PEZI|nr:hypothetical protein F5144DRAFT_179154 [Chaetomium globosum]